MPIYEYQCLDCSKDFEKLVRGSSPAPACPECGSTALRKKLSTFAAHSASAPASASLSEMPSPCGSCGAPGGPGSCGFQPA